MKRTLSLRAVFIRATRTSLFLLVIICYSYRLFSRVALDEVDLKLKLHMRIPSLVVSRKAI